MAVHELLAVDVASELGDALSLSFGMFWEILWALILGFAIFSRKLLDDAFPSALVWIAGFFLLPWTTITYAVMWGIYSDRVSGVEWVFVAGAFVLDLITWSTLRNR